ncbi:MAG TPA: hypothetical protein VMS18_17360 [Candidatus Binatia bacterium]|nr:hypothetical protein [Candidatus Binatia bacterium]
MRIGLILALLPFLFLSTFVSATKKSIPPTEKDLIGVWIGWEEGQLAFTRVDLRANSMGYCARIFAGTDPEVYQIRRWSMDGWNLKIDLTPISPKIESIYLVGLGGRGYLQLKVSAVGGKWHRKLVLLPESDVETAQQNAKQAIEHAKRDLAN